MLHSVKQRLCCFDKVFIFCQTTNQVEHAFIHFTLVVGITDNHESSQGLLRDNVGAFRFGD